MKGASIAQSERRAAPSRWSFCQPSMMRRARVDVQASSKETIPRGAASLSLRFGNKRIQSSAAGIATRARIPSSPVRRKSSKSLTAASHRRDRAQGRGRAREILVFERVTACLLVAGEAAVLLARLLGEVAQGGRLEGIRRRAGRSEPVLVGHADRIGRSAVSRLEGAQVALQTGHRSSEADEAVVVPVAARLGGASG